MKNGFGLRIVGGLMASIPGFLIVMFVGDVRWLLFPAIIGLIAYIVIAILGRKSYIANVIFLVFSICALPFNKTYKTL